MKRNEIMFPSWSSKDGWICWMKYIPSRITLTRSIWKMLGPFTTASRLTPIHQMSLAVLSRAACASMSTTTTTTTRDRGDRYGPMEWAQQVISRLMSHAAGVPEVQGHLQRRKDRQWTTDLKTGPHKQHVVNNEQCYTVVSCACFKACNYCCVLRAKYACSKLHIKPRH